MSAERAVLFFGFGLCLLWALIPSVLFPNPPLDVVEGFAWGKELAFGYTKHPPLQAWLLELSYRITGGGTLGGYWLSQISIGLGYFCIWHLAKRLGLTPWQAFWSVVLTSVTFYFTLPAPEFNPNIMQIPLWAGMILVVHRALQQGRLLDWLLLGILAAFGLYTKYFVALLIGTIGLYVLVYPEARTHLLTIGPWLTALVCLMLLTPHALWLLETDLLTLQYAASRSKGADSWTDHIFNPVHFLGAQIGNHAGLFIVVFSGFGLTGLKAFRIRLAEANIDRNKPSDKDRFLLWFAFLPLGVVLSASAVTGNEFEHMWGTPLFILSGVVAVRYLRLPTTWVFQRRPLIAALAIQTIFLSIIIGQAVFEPYWKKKQTRMHYPGLAIAHAMSQEWSNATGTPIAYVAGDMWSAANITNNAQERPSMFYHHDPVLSPWIDLEDVQKKGVMLIWRGNSETPPRELLRYYPDVIRQGTRNFSYISSAEIAPVQVNWVIIKPGMVAVNPVQ